MGMPITTYNVLDALDDGAESEIRVARQALAPFSLFAFIIHDPDADETTDFGRRNRAFDRKISQAFDYLDHLTGKNLLFFALVDPPKEWLERLKHEGPRPYYNHSLDHQSAMTSNDKSVTAFSLAQSLGIPHEMLPCLVITPDFSARSALWLRTCPEHVDRQLGRLGYRARQATRIPADRSFFEEIRKEINLCKGSGLTTLVSSLAKVLADVMSFIIDEDCSDLNPVRRSNRIQDTLRRLQDVLNYRKTVDTLAPEELDNLCVKIVAFRAHLNRRTDLSLRDFIHIDPTLLEPDSQIILRTAYMVTDLFERSPRRIIDYTPAVICLAKIFEREVNLSVIHWIRQQCGVRLPQYFDLFYPRSSEMYDGVNFNRAYDSKTWSPPTLGQSLEACKTIGPTPTRQPNLPTINLPNPPPNSL